MKDITESTIIVTLLVAIIFFAGVFNSYIFGIKDYLRIPEKQWKCTKAIVINDDPSNTECIRYERIETR